MASKSDQFLPFNTQSEPTGAEETFLNVFRARKAHALNYYQVFFSRIARRYDLFRGVYRGQFTQGRNNIHIPFIIALIESDVARKTLSIFNNNPLVEFEGNNPQIARKNSILISKQMEDCRSFEKASDFFLTADMYGTGIARDGWKTVRRFEQWRELQNAPSGVQQEVVNSGYVTRFDGPDWDVIDILDFWPQPGRRTLQECQWAMVRYFIDMNELEMMAEVGVYDKAKVKELKDTWGPPQRTVDSLVYRYNVYRSTYDFDARVNEKFSKPVEMIDMIGYVPDEAAIGGMNFIIGTVANDRVVLRRKPFPFWHGELPFLTYSPMRDPHYIHGVGKIEVVEKVQYMANRFANQKADALDRYIDPPVFYNRLMGIDDQNMALSPGRMIGVDGPVDDTVIRAIPTDLRGLMEADREIGWIWGVEQQAMGISEDTVMGFNTGGADRQTKAEFVGRQENVLTRLALEARLAEVGFVEPLANRMRMNNRQFLKLPHEMRILGESGAIDEITGLPREPEQIVIDLADLNPPYDARARGASQMMGKAVQQQNLMLLLQTIQVNPVAVQVINWNAFLRYTFKTYDIPNVEEFMVKNRIPAVNQVADDSGMSPGGVDNAASGALSGETSPQVLSQLLGSMGQLNSQLGGI